MSGALMRSLSLVLGLCLALAGCDAGPEEEGDHCGEETLFVPCPSTTIVVDEGDRVFQGTLLHLEGQLGPAADGPPLVEWRWSVVAPEGATGAFLPSPSHPTPTFTPDEPGPYLFLLASTDADGVDSCEVARQLVEVEGEPLTRSTDGTALGQVPLERDDRAMDAGSPTAEDTRLFQELGSGAP